MKLLYFPRTKKQGRYAAFGSLLGAMTSFFADGWYVCRCYSPPDWGPCLEADVLYGLAMIPAIIVAIFCGNLVALEIHNSVRQMAKDRAASEKGALSIGKLILLVNFVLVLAVIFLVNYTAIYLPCFGEPHSLAWAVAIKVICTALILFVAWWLAKFILVRLSRRAGETGA